MDAETRPDEDEKAAEPSEEVEAYVEEVESDPAHNPEDPDLKAMKGG